MTEAKEETYRICIDEASFVCRPYSVAIAHRDGINIDRVSSGTLMEIRGRKLVLTCAHFLSDYNPEELVLVASNRMSSPRPWVSQIAYCPNCSEHDPLSNDIAIVDLMPDLELPDCKFLAPVTTETSVARIKEDLLLLVGSPLSEIQTDPEGHHAVNVTPVMTEWGNEYRVYPNFKHGDDLVVIIPDADFAISSKPGAVRIPNPDGMSGGGIWTTGFAENPVGGVWKATDIKLAGVMTDRYPIEYGTNVYGANIRHLLDLEAGTRHLALSTGDKIEFALPCGKRICVIKH